MINCLRGVFSSSEETKMLLDEEKQIGNVQSLEKGYISTLKKPLAIFLLSTASVAAVSSMVFLQFLIAHQKQLFKI